MTRFRLDSGHAAVDFVNTRPLRDGQADERLARFADLAAWAQAAGLLAQDDPLADRGGSHELSLALEIREAMRAVFAGGFGDAAIGKAIGLINAALARRPGFMALDQGDAGPVRRFRAPLETPAHLVAAIANLCANGLVALDPARVKPCSAAHCVLWFVDRTRNGSRHWCSMNSCGARAKSAAYYRRHKQAAARG